MLTPSHPFPGDHGGSRQLEQTLCVDSLKSSHTASRSFPKTRFENSFVSGRSTGFLSPEKVEDGDVLLELNLEVRNPRLDGEVESHLLRCALPTRVNLA